MTLAAALLLAASLAPAQPSLTQAEQDYLVCRASREQALIELRWNEFDYIKDEIREKVDSGRTVGREVVSKQVFRTRWGVGVNRTVARDGVPLAGQAAATAERKYRQRLEQLEEDLDERRQSIEKRSKELRDKVVVLSAIPQAFDFHLEGFEFHGNHPCWVVSFFPKPGYRPEAKEQGYLENFTGLLWIDAERHFFRRIEAEFIHGVSVKFGPFATLTPGSRLYLENEEIEPGRPMATIVDLDLRIRIFFVFSRYERRGTHYREFRRRYPEELRFAP